MDHDTLAIDNYNKKIIKDPRVETLLLPIRDGIMVNIYQEMFNNLKIAF